MKTGIQVSSLKPLLKTPSQVREAFSRMAALGCGPVQLQWIDPAVSIADIARTMAEFSMKSLGTQDFYEIVAGNLEYYVNLNAETKGTWLTVSRIPERCKSPEGLELFTRELTALQEKLEPLDQRVCFHPVTADYQAVPGMDPVAYLLEKLPWLELCLDLYHLNRNCADMPGFLRRYAGRIPMVHFKDADREGTLVPAGQGCVNWTGVVPACAEAGVQWALAEQETWTRDPYDCLKEALDWIEKQL